MVSRASSSISSADLGNAISSGEVDNVSTIKSRTPLMVPLTESNKSDGTDDMGILGIEDVPGDEVSLLLAIFSSF
jgi:hypothetical protein